MRILGKMYQRVVPGGTEPGFPKFYCERDVELQMKDDLSHWPEADEDEIRALWKNHGERLINCAACSKPLVEP